MHEPFFPDIESIPYEGPDSDNPLAFRWYDADRVVRGRTMAEHLRFGVCYWHSFNWPGADIFGVGTFDGLAEGLALGHVVGGNFHRTCGMSNGLPGTAQAFAGKLFHQVNEASVGLRAVNLRHRLDACDVTDDHAGNYVHAIAYTPDNYASIGQIEESLETLKQRGEVPLPDFSWNMTSSVSVSWDSFFRQELVLGADITQRMHLPLYNLETLGLLPDRVSMLNTFTLHPAGVNGEAREIGVLVQCRKSVCEKIVECGIVKEELVYVVRKPG